MADLKKRFENFKQSRFWAISKKVLIGLSFAFNAVILLLLLVGLSSCGARPTFAADSSSDDSSVFPSPGGTLSLRYDMGNAGLSSSVDLPVGTNQQIGGATYLTYDSTASKVGYRYTNYAATDKIPAPSWKASDLGLLIWNVRSTGTEPIGLSNMPYVSFAFIPYQEYYDISLVTLTPTPEDNPAYNFTTSSKVYHWYLGYVPFTIGSVFGTSEVSPSSYYSNYPTPVSFSPSVVTVSGGNSVITKVFGLSFQYRFLDYRVASVYLSALYVDLVVTPSNESAIEDYYNFGYNTGREDGYNTGYGEGVEFGKASAQPINTFSSLLANAFDSISSILNLDLFGLSLGTWLFIPVTIGLVFVVLRIFNHG